MSLRIWPTTVTRAPTRTSRLLPLMFTCSPVFSSLSTRQLGSTPDSTVPVRVRRRPGVALTVGPGTNVRVLDTLGAGVEGAAVPLDSAAALLDATGPRLDSAALLAATDGGLDGDGVLLAVVGDDETDETDEAALPADAPQAHRPTTPTVHDPTSRSLAHRRNHSI